MTVSTRFMQIALAFLAVTYFLSAINGANNAGTQVDSTSYSQFLEEVNSSQVKEVTIDGQEIRGERVDGTRFRTYSPDDPGLVGDLVNNGVTIRAIPPREPSFLGQLFVSLLPILLLLGVWIFFMRRIQGGAGGSGILSIAARRLGASLVVGVDIDPDALAAARRNLGLNRLSSKILLVNGTLACCRREFDLIAANLDATTLVRHREPLRTCLAQGGRAILSGMLAQEGPGVTSAFKQAGFLPIAAKADPEEGWASVLLKKR